MGEFPKPEALSGVHSCQQQVSPCRQRPRARSVLAGPPKTPRPPWMGQAHAPPCPTRPPSSLQPPHCPDGRLRLGKVPLPDSGSLRPPRPRQQMGHPSSECGAQPTHWPPTPSRGSRQPTPAAPPGDPADPTARKQQPRFLCPARAAAAWAVLPSPPGTGTRGRGHRVEQGC